MRIISIILVFCFIFSEVSGQVETSNTKASLNVKLPFKLINNLIVLPVKVNGVELNFLVDTGIKETILFSIDEKKTIPLFDIERVKLKGLGTLDFIEGLKSYRNTLSFNKLVFENQEIVVILDQDFNFSSVLGIEVNGIIGFHFFASQMVEINYDRKVISIHNRLKSKTTKLLSKFEAFDIVLAESKPYLSVKVKSMDTIFDAKCLIDSGNSDGLWLFQGRSDAIKVPDLNFEDYLGRGFSGDVFGKKAKVEQVSLRSFEFKNVVTAFPYKESYENLVMVQDRVGSVGGDFLRRFNVIFDYQNQKLYLKKNRQHNEKFKYNITGITFHHAGLQWYKEEIKTNGLFLSNDNSKTKNYQASIQYNFRLVPVFEILSIRANSLAEKAGLQIGDQVLSINNKSTSRMTLQKLNTILYSEAYKKISLLVLREGKRLAYQIELEDLL